jgi:hypothetical protein
MYELSVLVLVLEALVVDVSSGPPSGALPQDGVLRVALV